jgi:hypothetical protein
MGKGADCLPKFVVQIVGMLHCPTPSINNGKRDDRNKPRRRGGERREWRSPSWAIGQQPTATEREGGTRINNLNPIWCK